MRHSHRVGALARTALPAAAVLCLVLGGLVDPAAARGIRDPEVLIEGGVSLPAGDLDRPFGLLDGAKGLGAETGYEIGARFRYWFGDGLAISPAFHYVDFGDFSAYDEQLGPYQVGASILRYGADLQVFLPGDERRLRLYLTGGAGLYHNRYRDELTEDPNLGYDYSYSEQSFDALGFSFGGGLRMADFEVSAVYHVNRFETARLLAGSAKEKFDWDFISVRFGLAFPTR